MRVWDVSCYKVTWLEYAGLDSSDGHGADAADLVHVLQRQAQRLLGGPRRGLDGVQSLYAFIYISFIL